MGSVALTIVLCVAAFLAMVVVVRALDVFRDVRIARWTGQDPRTNPAEVASAADTVRARKNPPDA